MPSVKRNNFDIFGTDVETTHVNAIAVRIGTRNIEGFDAANLAEQVFCDSGIELVFDEKLGALMQSKLIFRNDQMKKSAFATNGAVALESFDCGRR